MTTLNADARPGFRITRAEDLEERDDGVILYPGVTAYPVVWASPKDGTGQPVPREAFVKFDVGASYPEPDVHTDSSETVLVLYGMLQDENGTYTPGTRIEGARGSWHTPSSPTGCLLHVTFPDR